MGALNFASVRIHIHVSVANAFGALPGIGGIYLTGWVLDITNHDWSIVFLVAAALSTAATLLMLVRTIRSFHFS